MTAMAIVTLTRRPISLAPDFFTITHAGLTMPSALRERARTLP
jgi:hypothetical protein